jgi:hypothetical protein
MKAVYGTIWGRDGPMNLRVIWNSKEALPGTKGGGLTTQWSGPGMLGQNAVEFYDRVPSQARAAPFPSRSPRVVRPPQKPLIFWALIIDVALLQRLISALARNGDPQE